MAVLVTVQPEALRNIVRRAALRSGKRLCELLQLCWSAYPNMALAVDRHFTSPAQRAVVDTFIHRHWPKQGVLTIAHVDSQRNPMVQLADFVAGGMYDWHKQGDRTYRLLEGKIGAELVESWRHVKRRWLQETK